MTAEFDYTNQRALPNELAANPGIAGVNVAANAPLSIRTLAPVEVPDLRLVPEVAPEYDQEPAPQRAFPTEVDRILATQFADVKWKLPSKEKRPLVTRILHPDPLDRNREDIPARFVGLRSDNLRGGAVVRFPEESWVAGIFGARVVSAATKENPDAVTVEVTNLRDMERIQHTFAREVLVDEDTRLLTFSDVPEPAKGVSARSNNNRWLQIIKNGGIPVLREVNSSEAKGDYDYDEHDYTDHLASFTLLPREVQAMITEAAGYELAWRAIQADQALLRDFVLPGEHDTSASVVGNNAVAKIDSISGGEEYSMLLSHLIAEREIPVAERLDELLATDLDSIPDSFLFEVREGVDVIREQVEDLANFNTRHREGREATIEELDEAYDQFLQGTIRVAEKIRGTYSSAIGVAEERSANDR